MKRKILDNTQRRCSGQGLVEFAMVLPIFLIVLLGMFEVGRILFTVYCLDRSAREGAREGITRIQDADAVNFAVTASRNSLASCGLNDQNPLGDFNTQVAAVIVPLVGADGISRDGVQVTVSRVFNFIYTTAYLIKVGTFDLFPATLPLNRVAVMRKEA